ncbi:MAG: formiminoglutamase [Bdellovibrio sp.]|nr:MAG: formiminoglutamase [Bdellovibrio sp.]
MNFFVSIPHSGEKVPEEAFWLRGLSEPHLMRDVDRYVHSLYLPALKKLQIPHVISPWHRYAADLNRFPEDVDQDSVEGSPNPPGTFTTGLHWVKTTLGEPLMKKPISQKLHQQLVKKYYEPFHQEVQKTFKDLSQEKGAVFHLDAHSMPSMGTAAHRDPGEKRAEVVISDVNGKSCKPEWKDLVMEAFKESGFQVAYNWPYIGGRITQRYGKPQDGQNSIQVELNRALYMNEETKKPLDSSFSEVQDKIFKALEKIVRELPALLAFVLLFYANF